MLGKICCFNTDACKCSCWGLTRNKNVKIAYIAVILLAYLILILINSTMDAQSSSTLASYSCQDSPNKAQCVDDKNSVIIFAGVSFMHLMLMFCMFLKSQKVKVINEGIWIIKILIIALVALIYRLVVATTFFEYIQYFSIWVANLLYVFEAIVFIDLVYALDNSIDECAKDNHKFYILKAIISITILLLASFICFMSFSHNSLWICWTNAIALIIFVIMALVRIFPGNSILVASSVGLCMNVLGFYVQDSSNDHIEQDHLFLSVLKGLFLLFLLLGMVCQGSNKLRTKKSSLNQLFALNTNPSQQDNRYVSSNKWTVYHYVMMMITISIPAVFCWQGAETDSQISSWLDINKIVWWGAMLFFYLWSLIVSKVYPEQDFSDLQNYFRQYQLN